VKTGETSSLRTAGFTKTGLQLARRLRYDTRLKATGRSFVRMCTAADCASLCHPQSRHCAPKTMQSPRFKYVTTTTTTTTIIRIYYGAAQPVLSSALQYNNVIVGSST